LWIERQATLGEVTVVEKPLHRVGCAREL